MTLSSVLRDSAATTRTLRSGGINHRWLVGARIDERVFFRVNGAAVYPKGANMVPMEGIEGHVSAPALHYLVPKAALSPFRGDEKK